MNRALALVCHTLPAPIKLGLSPGMGSSSIRRFDCVAKLTWPAATVIVVLQFDRERVVATAQRQVELVLLVGEGLLEQAAELTPSIRAGIIYARKLCAARITPN